MRSYDLKPTFENLKQTYLDDSIGRDAHIFYFINILNILEGSFSIALDGNWGSGKTFFIKQVKMVLEANNDFIQSMEDNDKQSIKNKQCSFLEKSPTLVPQVCVYYDAWENDNDEDPILSLIYTIMQSISTDFTFKSRDYIKIGVTLMDHFRGTDWEKMISSLKSEDPLETLEKKKTLASKINEFLASLLPERGDRLIIFIDELDRCNPQYAVRLLERIKHYFDNENITFVFSVNINELQHTIKNYYGSFFDGARYLDRFFDLRVGLPSIDPAKYYSQLNSQLKFSVSNQVWAITCDALIRTYHMELREISRYIQLCKLAIGDYLDQLEQSRSYFSRAESCYCLMYVVPIMIALKLTDFDRYYKFIHGQDSSPLVDVSAYLSIGFFSDLLDGQETFEANSSTSQCKVVKLEDKLVLLYNALFCTDYSKTTRFQRIGKTQFDSQTKNMVEQVANLLSTYTQFYNN